VTAAKVTYPSGTKPCSGCKEELPLSSYYLRKDGYYQSRCQSCMQASNRKWADANQIPRKARRYGVCEEVLASMFDDAAGRCGICDRERELHVDHCHDTGRVRGLLCGPCNRSIGVLGDNVEGLRRALRYLRGDDDA
jgi:hypothetical protein